MWKRSSFDRSLALAFDSLAGLVRSGPSIEWAIAEWHRCCPAHVRPALRRLADLLALGLSPSEALEVGKGADPVLDAVATHLIAILELHERHSGELAGSIGDVAVWMNERCTDLDRGRVAAAGAKLSGRMVAALPLLFVPFRPIGRAPMFDGIGIVTLVLGISLALAGMSWIARLVPAPPQRDDPEDRFVRSAVVLLRGGMPLRQALGAAAGSAGGEPRTASDHVALGASWGEALDLCSDPLLRSMSNVVDRGERLGASVTAELQELADRRREMVERSFEARLRRAPVLMMVPLTLCVLPSFGFLALTPFVRGLVSG